MIYPSLGKAEGTLKLVPQCKDWFIQEKPGEPLSLRCYDRKDKAWLTLNGCFNVSAKRNTKRNIEITCNEGTCKGMVLEIYPYLP